MLFFRAGLTPERLPIPIGPEYAPPPGWRRAQGRSPVHGTGTSRPFSCRSGTGPGSGVRRYA